MLNKLLQKNKILSKICTPISLCLVAFLVLNIYLLYSTYITKVNTKNFFRIHVVANSDSIQDQLLKYKVADKVDKYTSALLNDATLDKESCKKAIEENMQNILNICETEINSSNLNYTVYANIGNMYYDEKAKDGLSMEKGLYDSLKIVIGEGKGENWWSLIYPNAYDAVVIDEGEKSVKKDDTHHLTTSDIISSNNISIKFGIIEFLKSIFT